MNRQLVQSSNIRAIGYDPKTRVMQIQFHDGGVYDYADVPPSEHQALMTSKSIGGRFHSHIKSKYQSKRVGSAPRH